MKKSMLVAATASLFVASSVNGASSIIELALHDVGSGSREVMQERIFRRPHMIFGAGDLRKAISLLPSSIREKRITDGKLWLRVERVSQPVLQIQHQDDNVELFLYRGDGLSHKAMLWHGCILVIADCLAARLNDAELAGIVAHELGHSYFMDEIVVAQKHHNDQALKVVELKCDAVAMLTLKLMHYDPSQFVEGVRGYVDLIFKDGYNLNYDTHPSLLERVEFARRFIKLLV